MSSFWILIIIASVISYAFRIIPFFIIKLKNISKESSLIVFFNYASYAVIGSLIYSIGFNNQDLNSLISNFNLETLVKFLIIILTFIFSIWLDNVIATFIISITIFSALAFII